MPCCTLIMCLHCMDLCVSSRRGHALLVDTKSAARAERREAAPCVMQLASQLMNGKSGVLQGWLACSTALCVTFNIRKQKLR